MLYGDKECKWGIEVGNKVMVFLRKHKWVAISMTFIYFLDVPTLSQLEIIEQIMGANGREMCTQNNVLQ